MKQDVKGMADLYWSQLRLIQYSAPIFYRISLVTFYRQGFLKKPDQILLRLAFLSRHHGFQPCSLLPLSTTAAPIIVPHALAIASPLAESYRIPALLETLAQEQYESL